MYFLTQIGWLVNFHILSKLLHKFFKIPIERLTVTAVMGNVKTDVASTIFHIFLQYLKSERKDMHNTCENGFELIFIKLWV